MTTFLDLPPEIRNRVYFFTIELYAEDEVDSDLRASFGMVNSTLFGASYEPGQYRSSKGLAFSRCVKDHVDFPTQPTVSKTSRKIREETLAIFYGGNSFLINDDSILCPYEAVAPPTPFSKVVFDFFERIRPHLPLMTDVKIRTFGESAQESHELVAALMDYGFEFKSGALGAVGALGI